MTELDRGHQAFLTNTNSSQDTLAQELNAMQRNEQAQAEQMFLLALHERLAQQLRPQTELQRIWQNMMLGLPALLPPLDLTALPGTSQTLMHPLYQSVIADDVTLMMIVCICSFLEYYDVNLTIWNIFIINYGTAFLNATAAAIVTEQIMFIGIAYLSQSCEPKRNGCMRAICSELSPSPKWFIVHSHIGCNGARSRQILHASLS
ncbi:Forkhead box protein P1 [Dirofilaria immitis]|nr:Forkhead box protein P1 [Dirofilaria immitis]